MRKDGVVGTSLYFSPKEKNTGMPIGYYLFIPGKKQNLSHA